MGVVVAGPHLKMRAWLCLEPPLLKLLEITTVCGSEEMTQQMTMSILLRDNALFKAKYAYHEQFSKLISINC